MNHEGSPRKGETGMSFKVTDTVTWVGKRDWELRRFHGEEYSTHRGSTYNAYLVQDEKTALVETVWAPFAGEFIDQLKTVVDLDRIDYVIANHAESDHSGGLPELMRLIPDVPVFCTANGVKSLKGHYHQDWNFQVVKTGQRLSLGSRELLFIEAPMLHWPDTMFCYLTGDEILFSNDAFGHHLASEGMYNDLVDPCMLMEECIKYYANILNPFSSLVAKKINDIVALRLPIDMICPSHGVFWRSNPLQIVENYAKWAAAYKENQITIIYDTMWDGTRRMAEGIAAGIRTADPDVIVKLYNSSRTDKNDIITEVFKSKAILVGCPTVNKGILSSLAGLMEEVKGLAFKEKKAAAFGTYGWSGEGPKVLARLLTEAGFAVMDSELKGLWSPEEKACQEFGRRFSEFSK